MDFLFGKDAKNTLAEQFRGRENNLDLIRFIAAAMVIYFHAHPLVRPDGKADFLYQFSNGQIHIGNLAVCVFFLFSGFLIAKSAERTVSGPAFFKARILRLIPPLAVVTILCAFVLGPIMTELPLKEYFTDPKTYAYLGNSILIPVHELPGVFLRNPYNATVNGALWTLPIEAICYVVCYLFCRTGFLNARRMRWTIPLFVILYIGGSWVFRNNDLIASVLHPCGMFYMGMLAYVYRDRIRLSAPMALLALAVFLISLRRGMLEIFLLICVPYLLLMLAFGTPKKATGFGKYGDFSYGMYLTGWPLAQVLVQYVGNRLSVGVQALIVIILSTVCGALLHWWVERPILLNKRGE